jgi:hypothetical protein
MYEQVRERAVLGPPRCLCDEPEQPYRIVDGGRWGSLACRRCARMLISAQQPTEHSARVRIARDLLPVLHEWSNPVQIMVIGEADDELQVIFRSTARLAANTEAAT